MLYTGVTSDLKGRLESHRTKKYPNAFTARYNADKLVWFQEFDSIIDARTREKQLKAGNRARKIKLIEEINSECLPDCLSSNRMMPFGRSGGERLIRNIVKCREGETASALSLNKLFSKAYPTALLSLVASPRGILHLIIFSAHTSLHKTNFVVRLCEGGTTEANNICSTSLRGSFYAEGKRRQKNDRGSLKQLST